MPLGLGLGRGAGIGHQNGMLRVPRHFWPSWGDLVICWVIFGHYGAILGAIVGFSGAMLGDLGGHVGVKGAPRPKNRNGIV